MKIVLDTNVIVSAFLNPNGLPSQIFKLILNKMIGIVYCGGVLAEYDDVLNRDYLKINKDSVNSILNFIEENGEYGEPVAQDIEFNDEDLCHSRFEK